jgi:DNA-binding IclR family transcriptional regulator
MDMGHIAGTAIAGTQVAGTQVAGTQVVGRIAHVLRAVSTTMPHGLSTTEIATRTGLARPTAHRLLSALTSQGFVDHDTRTGRWLLGPELYIMGTVAAERYDITELARESVRALAATTGESAFFSARRGDETVCLLREDGSFPVRSHVLYEGVRFPLGVASAGIVILSLLPEREVDDYLAARDLAHEWGENYTSAALRDRVERTRATGYAVNPGLVVEGSWGMAAAVFDASGNPAWALSLTGIESRFAPRQAELGRLLLEHAHRITQRLPRS